MILSVGLGLIFFPTTLIAVSGASPRESGLASAVLNVSQQLGGSIGVALLGTVAAGVTKSHLVNVRPTHELVSRAVTAGFTTTFEIGALIALAGFVLTMLVIRAPAPGPVAEALSEAA